MKNGIIISSTPEEVRMGLIEEGELREYVVERTLSATLVGTIFSGRVDSVVPGIQAAFVDIGEEKNAFLYMGKKHDLTEGMKLMVQITKDPRGTKGPTASREITLPGRYAVLTPFDAGIGISHNIKNGEERNRLYEIVERLHPEGMGVVVRTAAENVSEEALRKDICELHQQWKIIEAKAGIVRPPAFLHRELDLPIRIVRDYFTNDMEAIVVDENAAAERIRELMKELPCSDKVRVESYSGGEDVFAAYGLADEIAGLSDRRVDLPGGAYLIIDRTEAMTVIDVNSGSYKSSGGLEETLMQTNRMAARAIAKHLRLRDIGGIIVVDFIDMHTEAGRQEIMNILSAAFKGDRMKPRVQDITALDLVEITRKKSRRSPEAAMYEKCPVCSGSGRVQSKETIALEIKRRIRTLLRQGSGRELLIVAHPLEADYLRFERLKDWNRELNCNIEVERDPSLHVENFMILDNSGAQ